jgi:heme-degrading monooxygenase HmoA
MAHELPPLAATPAPPYFAVIFSSVRTGADGAGYAAMSERLLELAGTQPGFLGIESVRDAAGVGVTVSYWRSLEAVRAWGRHAEHLHAQAMGRACWYETFRLRICRVEQDRLFERPT